MPEVRSWAELSVGSGARWNRMGLSHVLISSNPLQLRESLNLNRSDS